MKIFLTGATGFIGGALARALRARGDDVVALVRNPDKAGDLRDAGVTLVSGGLDDVGAIERGLEGADAAIHGAAVYEVGIKSSEREPMRAANVDGTANVLGAALRAGTPKVVYVSTIGVYGNTHGEIVDETYEHPGKEFGSYYEQTKTEAHEIAKRLTAEGLPLVIIQPGGVYGPQDHSAVGDLLLRFANGKLPAMAFPDLGFNLVHRDDVVAGVLLGLDKGVPGESYNIGSEITTMKGMIETAAKVLDRKPPSRSVPNGLIKAIAPLGPVVGPLMGFPPNLREAYAASAGVTYWGSHDKAMRELGYAPRSLEQGLRDTLEAEGKLPAAAASA
jgi:nucleoside-diphosphate-sugar epimerase